MCEHPGMGVSISTTKEKKNKTHNKEPVNLWRWGWED